MQDVLDLRSYLNSINGDKVKIIAKIENEEGIENYDDILNVVAFLIISF